MHTRKKKTYTKFVHKPMIWETVYKTRMRKTLFFPPHKQKWNAAGGYFIWQKREKKVEETDTAFVIIFLWEVDEPAWAYTYVCTITFH